MNESFWIIGEVIVGIALLGVLSAVITAVMVPLLSKTTERTGATQVLEARYARGELTRDQYLQMRQDLGIGFDVMQGRQSGSADEREAVSPGSRQAT